MFAMSDPDDHHHDQPPQPSFELIEGTKKAVGEMEDAARKLGLYLQDHQLAMDPRDPTKMIIIGQFLIGDVAWSDRVQNPQVDAETDQIKTMESDLAKQEFVELRERLERRARGEE